MTGLIYILTNPAIPDLVKIGRTQNLEERVRSLSSHSGVPIPFEVYYSCEVNLPETDRLVRERMWRLRPREV